MKIISRIRNILITLLLLGAAGGILYLRLRPKEKKEEIRIEEARVVDLRPIAELCTMEIYREVMVEDTINRKVIYGIQKQQGSITFDLESLPASVKVARSTADSLATDTLRLRLPKETVSILESTDADSWKVIDTKSLSLFGSSKMTSDEENRAKRKAIERTRRSLYHDGTVERARREAASTLREMAERLTGRPVVVEDK